MMKARLLVKQCSILMMIFSMAGCSFLSPVKTAPDHLYLIEASPASVPVKHKRKGTLLVMEPETIPIYNTTQMAYTPRPFEIAFYGMNRWAETPGQMLLPLMVKTLERTRNYRAVVAPPFTSGYDYVLTTQILKIRQNYYLCVPPKFEFEARVQLSRTNGRVLAVARYNIDELIRSPNPYGGVIAANIAITKFLRNLAYFTNQHH